MNFLKGLFKKEPAGDSKSEMALSASHAEEIIAGLRQNQGVKPIFWVVCYENRPLQGTPPGSDKPHLMIFASSALADGFIEERKKIFMPEPLSIVGISSPSVLKELATAPSKDSRYAGPPCGLLLNFTYPTGATDATLSPQTVESMSAEKIMQVLSVKEKNATVTNKIDLNKCSVCGRELNFKRGYSGMNDSYEETFQEAVMRLAYKCRKCGSPICRRCAEKSLCPQCGGNTFDVDMERIK